MVIPLVGQYTPVYVNDITEGKSAYQVAIDDGFIGTVEEWLISIEGATGKSAFELATENGYTGTLESWISSLHGTDGIGVDGKSAYQLALDNGYVGTVEEWLATLVGIDGKSAYDLAVENGFIGTSTEWIASLHGEDGISIKGDPGDSIYEIAVEEGFVGTQTEWLTKHTVSRVDFETTEPLLEWIINHGIGKKPLVTAFDSTGNNMLVNMDNGTMTTTIIFDEAIAGSAILIG